MAKTDMQKTAAETAMTRPSFVAEGRDGTEHITQADIQIPRILIAQKMSPEVDPGDAKLIEGLKIGDMFNSLTKQVYGRGPLTFAIVRADRPRFVEFIPREQGGGIADPNVPADDPRTQFGPNGQKPTATKFYDYIIVLMPVGSDPLASLVALSFKSTGIKVAKSLNAMIQLRNAPIYAGLYTLSSADAQNKHGKFSVPAIANAGWVQDEALFAQLKALSESIRHKEFVIDREPGDDDTDFPPVPSGDQPGSGTVGEA